MRRLPQRPELPNVTNVKLQEKTQEILQTPVAAGARKLRARQIYEVSRQTDWFQPVVVALRGLCGAGELCLYCSSNEPSQVEHFARLGSSPSALSNIRIIFGLATYATALTKVSVFLPTPSLANPY